MNTPNDAARRRFDELKAGQTLPSPRGVALNVLEMTARPDTSIRDIARVIKMDPAMAGRILRYVNVASGGARRAIASVEKAVTLLGMFRVRLIALGFSLIDDYRTGVCPDFDYEGYWTSSLATGIAAQKLAPLAQSPPDESFTCGLLCGIGRLAFATAFPDEYAAILRKTPLGPALLDHEKSHFGIDHVQLSAEMLNGWGMPEIFSNAIRNLERPATAPAKPGTRAHALATALQFAMRIGQLVNLDEAHRWEQIPSLFDAAARAGMEQQDVPALVDAVNADWRGWARELKLPSRQFADLRELLAAPPREPRNGKKLAAEIRALRVTLLVNDLQRGGALSQSLRGLGLSIEQASDLASVTARRPEAQTDVAIIDIGGGDCQAAARLKDLRSAAGDALYIIALIPVESESDALQLMSAGASDYLLYNHTEAALIARLSNAHRLTALQSAVRAERELAVVSSGEWARTNRRLLHEALTDALTQLPNRRYGIDRFAQEWDLATRNALPIACLMLDIDHFKLINDRHGHGVGDVVLQQIARITEHTCRRGDVIFRYGGEEFCVICPATAQAEAIHLGKRILTAVRSGHFGLRDDAFPVTLSIGIAVRTAEMAGPENLIGKADEALIAAKNGGRNRITSIRIDAPAKRRR